MRGLNQIFEEVGQYAYRFVYSALLKFTVVMMILPIVLVITNFFDARFPAWFTWLLVLVGGGKPTAGIEEFVQVIFLIVFVCWVIEEIWRYVMVKYFHKQILSNYGYQLKRWFWAVSLIYLIGLLSAPFTNMAAGSSVEIIYLTLVIFYIAAIIPLGFCWLLEFNQQILNNRQ